MGSLPIDSNCKGKNEAATSCLESDSPVAPPQEGPKPKATKKTDVFFVDASQTAISDKSSRTPFAARLAKSSSENGEAPENPSELLDQGKFYLDKKMFPQAVEVLQRALDASPKSIAVQYSLGRAYAGAGELKKSVEVLSRYLKEVPRDAMALKLRAEINLKFLKTLGEGASVEKAQIQREIIADQAMLLALNTDQEKGQLKQLEKQFRAVQNGSPEQLKEFLEAVDVLGHQYLQLGSVGQSNAQDTEFVRAQLNDLASQSFELLASLADASPHEDIKKLAPLYNGYHLLAQGDMEGARKTFEKIRKDVPEADTILKQMDGDRLKMVNLGALDAWEVSIEEHDAIWKDQDGSIAGRAFGGIVDVSHTDGKTHIDDFYGKLHAERDLVREVRSRIQKGSAPTIHEALTQIVQEDRKDFKEMAEGLLQKEEAMDHTGSYFVAHLVRYASALDHPTNPKDPDSNIADVLFRDMEQLQARYGGVQAAFAVVSLLQVNSSDASFQKSCEDYLGSLQQGKDLAGVLSDMIKTTGTDDLVQLVIMAGASKVGSLTKLAALTKLQSAGITGYKAMVLAYAAETVAEGTALWAMNTAHEATLHDTSKVFSADHLAKSYGTNLIMVGGLKLFGGAGQKFSPRVARSLGLVADGGARLSTAGEMLSWSLSHFVGLSGMIATTQVSQALGLAEVPQGGLQESLVRDIFTYVKYGIEQRGFDHALGEKATAAHQKLNQKTAVKQAELSAEAALKKVGFQPIRRTPEGKPVFADSVGQDLFGRLVHESLRRPGFDAGKLASLLQKQQLKEARIYLKGFGLTLKCEGTKVVGLGEVNPRVAEWLTLYAKSKEPHVTWEKFLQAAKGIAFSPAMMFLGAGGLGGGFPHFFPEAPLEKSFMAAVHEEVKKDPELITEIYYTAGEGEEAAAIMLADLAKVHPEAFYYMDNLANRGNETVHDLFKNFNPEQLSPKLDLDHSKYILAKYGNEAALNSLLSRAANDQSALEMAGWLAVDGNPKALDVIGKLALERNEALLDLAKAAKFGNEAAFPLLAKAFPTNPGRVFATFHSLVHNDKNVAAREFLKNFKMSDLDDRAQRTDWLYLMAECENTEAVRKLGSMARHDGDALHALYSLVGIGSGEALQQVGELAKSDEGSFRQLVRWAEEKNEGAQALLKNFPLTESGDTAHTVDRLYKLAKFGNRPALQQLFVKANDGDQQAITSIGLIACDQGHPKAIRLLGALAKTYPEALIELSHAAKAGRVEAKGQLLTLAQTNPQAEKELARL